MLTISYGYKNKKGLVVNSCDVQRIAQHAYQTLYREKPHHYEVRETLYGWIVFTLGQKNNVVIKFSKQIGQLQHEISHLQKLKQHLTSLIPNVLFFGLEEGLDFLVLEWLPGHSAHTLIGTETQQIHFADQYTDILLQLHEVTDSRGFQCTSEQFTPSITKAFEAWYKDIHHFITHDITPLPSELKRKYQYLWEVREEVLSPITNEPASLVHNGAHLGNVLFDPKTFNVTGLVDPGDCGYKHREWDIAHLNQVRPDLCLQEWYEKKHRLTDGHQKRQIYLQLWEQAKDMHRIGWHDPIHMQHQWETFHQIK